MLKTTLIFYRGKFQNLNFAQCSVCLNTIVERSDKLNDPEKDLPSQCPDCYGDIAWWLCKVAKNATVIPRIV